MWRLNTAKLLRAILVWKMRHVPVTSPWFSLTISLLLALTSITILPGQAVHDHVILLPGIFLIALTWPNWFSPNKTSNNNRALKVIVSVGALALFWQWLTGPPLLVLRYFLPPERFFTNPVLLLPYHAAASVPLAVSATLGYMMVRALREKQFEGQTLI
jgi:hypothetical protein